MLSSREVVTDRVGWIDAVRGIAILGVLVTHIGFLPAPFFILFHAFQIPVFVTVSGYLFSTTKSGYVWKRTQQLLFPYFLWGSMSLVLWELLLVRLPLFQEFSGNFFSHFQALLFGTSLIFNGPLWFLFVLWLGNLIFFVLSSFSKKVKQESGFFLCLALLSWFLGGILRDSSLRETVWFSLDLLLIFLGYLAWGQLVRRTAIFHRLGYGATFFLLFLFVLGSFWNGNVDFFSRSFGSFWMYILNSVIGSIAVMRLAYLLEKTGKKLDEWVSWIVRYCGRHSLILLVGHWPLLAMTNGILFSLVNLEGFGITPVFISFALSTESMRGVIFGLLLFTIYFLWITVVLLGLQAAWSGRRKRLFLTKEDGKKEFR